METYLRTMFRISAENRQVSRNLKAADSEAVIEPEIEDPAERARYAAELVHQGRFSEALQILDEVRQKKPEDARIHLALAELWSRLGDLTLAIPFAQQAVALDGQSFESDGFRQIASNTLVWLAPQLAVPLEAKSVALEKDVGRLVLAQADSSQASLHELSAREPEKLPILPGPAAAVVELPRQTSLKEVEAKLLTATPDPAAAQVSAQSDRS